MLTRPSLFVSLSLVSGDKTTIVNCILLGKPKTAELASNDADFGAITTAFSELMPSSFAKNKKEYPTSVTVYKYQRIQLEGK